jgi:hypothetical protein
LRKTKISRFSRFSGKNSFSEKNKFLKTFILDQTKQIEGEKFQKIVVSGRRHFYPAISERKGRIYGVLLEKLLLGFKEVVF